MISTALVFSSNQIDLVQVDTTSKKLLRAFSQALNANSIVRGKIVDTVFVDQAVKALLDKLPKKPKQLTLVIPEDAVISKSITLPEISKNEVDEAVSWEAENYLPYTLKEAVLDWKILENREKIHVLFQAISKEVIDAFVKIIQKHGVDIGVVETPAMAMARLAEDKPGIRLLIHVDNTGAVLTLAKNYEVVATSVISRTSNLTQSIKTTIANMINYYREFPVEWLQIGGMGVSSSMVKSLSVFKLPVTGFSLPITVQPAIANNFLLAISAAVREVLPPSDQDTINLLPTWCVSKQSKISQGKFLRKLGIYLAIFSLGLTASLASFYFWLTDQEKSLLTVQNNTSNVSREAMQTAGNINQLSSLVIKLADNDDFPLEFVNKIESQTEGKIKISQITVFSSERKGELIAMADDRAAMLKFKQEIEQIEEISQVQLPISSFAEEKNIPFSLNFSMVKKSVAKIKI
jgi:type IV pilus assembly PilM-like protein